MFYHQKENIIPFMKHRSTGPICKYILMGCFQLCIHLVIIIDTPQILRFNEIFWTGLFHCISLQIRYAMGSHNNNNKET